MSIRHFLRRASYALLFSACAAAQQYTVTTLAGDGTQGFIDGTALGSELYSPAAVAVASSGTIYISDPGNQRVRMLASGTVSTVAGNGTAGYTGDKAAGSSAEIDNPAGIVVDSSGSVFFADTSNHVIRKIDSAGVITTYAGNNNLGAGYTGDGGAATGAQLSSPLGLALDSSGNLYIADSGNKVIRKVSSTGTITSVVGAGNTVGRLNHPTGIAFDASGALYITDNGTGFSHVVKYVAGLSNPLSNFAGNQTTGYSGDGGQATLAQLNNPWGIAIDSAGNVYISESVATGRIRRVSTSGIITTIAGSGLVGYSGDGGLATSAKFNSPRGIALDKSGNIYIADSGNSVLRMLTPTYPAISDNGVTNAASYKPQISPGSLAVVFGTGFGTATSTSAIPYPTSVGVVPVTVTVNGVAAPLYYVSPTQIDFQVPWSTATGTASVAVTVNGGASKTVSVPVVAAGPGLFLIGNQAAALNTDYSINTPSNPASGLSILSAYLTGSGAVTPSQTDGKPAPLDSLVFASNCSATVGGVTASVQFCGLAPGWVGLVQLNIYVPMMTPGDYPLVVTIGGQASNSGIISVK